jgi:hypothetical protein
VNGQIGSGGAWGGKADEAALDQVVFFDNQSNLLLHDLSGMICIMCLLYINSDLW